MFQTYSRKHEIALYPRIKPVSLLGISQSNKYLFKIEKLYRFQQIVEVKKQTNKGM